MCHLSRVLTQLNPFHAIQPYLSFSLLFVHLCLDLPSGLFPTGFSTRILHFSYPHLCHLPFISFSFILFD
jgi:hypothetical protein